MMSVLAQITLLTSILGFLNPYTRMGGTELIYGLFRECPSGAGHGNLGLCVNTGSSSHTWGVIQSILATMMVKAVLTVITFGIRLPAGIFIPTLGVGACAGRIIGIGMQWFQMRYPDFVLFSACKGDLDCTSNCHCQDLYFHTWGTGIIPGLYAMVGAAATLSGVTVGSIYFLNIYF